MAASSSSCFASSGSVAQMRERMFCFFLSVSSSVVPMWAWASVKARGSMDFLPVVFYNFFIDGLAQSSLAVEPGTGSVFF